jgi:hypothetical protein
MNFFYSVESAMRYLNRTSVFNVPYMPWCHIAYKCLRNSRLEKAHMCAMLMLLTSA